jgi:putative ABC transport system substrate-binding protein
MRTRGVLVALMVGLVAASAAGQQPRGPFRVGILGNIPLTDAEGARVWGAFTEGLRELGYVEGQNLRIEHRSGEGHYERLPALAAELVRLNVDVIVAATVQNAQAAVQATRTIPIVVPSMGDPVASGLVASVAHPGGNVTGLSLLGSELAPKQLDILKEALPHVSRVAVLVNPANPLHPLVVGELKPAARSKGVRLHVVEARGPEAFDEALAAVARARAGALLVLADGAFLLHRARLADVAAKHRLPVMYGVREHMDTGGLLFYGASMRDSFRRAAGYVDKILKGAKPGDLPIEQASRFELVVSLRAANALRLTLPPTLLARADEVIQ